ncbi:MAG: hypothetical protein WD512_19290 [Candidatus Paceibacterota bacterium]
MNEARLGYLCTQTTKNRLTLDELSELLEWIVLEPKLLDLIAIETMLRRVNIGF